jgi:hypothetical protein
MVSLAALSGCGSDDEEQTGTGDSGGSSGGSTGGSAGSATGGSATGGSATGGSATGGSAGSAPQGGTGGSGGDGDRVETCRVYCVVYYDKDCGFSSANTYTNQADCRDVCVSSDWELGSPNDETGDSIQCRLTYAVAAQTTLSEDPEPDEANCGNASESSDSCS